MTSSPHSQAVIVPVVDEGLINKYDKSGPRYTSYPTAPQFTDAFDASKLEEEITAINTSAEPPPLSLYFHLPFCESVCFFCGCNVTFTSDRRRPAPYADVMIREMDMIAPRLKKGRKVKQLHWGGGTPTFFQPDQLERLFNAIRERFEFDSNAELGLEVDPRETKPEHFAVLQKLGFNRLSMGVQDFDPQVQKAVNRIQPEDITRATISEARQRGFNSINMDLIYGLPYQSEASFTTTLDKIISVNPDRIALFNFAYLPEMIRHQKAINASALPSPTEKLAILRKAISLLTDAGYRFIGMDHFAKPDDEMCRAQDDGTLYRNFQGYTTHAGCDLHAFGVSSISQVGPTYSQNLKYIHEYTDRVEAGSLPVQRGLKLTHDDLIRRDAIMTLLCLFHLDADSFSKRHGIQFHDYFKDSLEALGEMEKDGLLSLSSGGITVHPAGRLLIRNICMAFDAYLAGKQHKFSRTV